MSGPRQVHCPKCKQTWFEDEECTCTCLPERGTLNPGEPHPAAYDAMKWLRTISHAKRLEWLEAFSSCAIEGNRLSEVCADTLRRFIAGDPVSDRYLLGLVWTMREWKGAIGDE